MSAYETMLVISTKFEEEETAALLKRFTDLISENGNIVAVDEWGKRRLAYEIQKEKDGYYALITFESDPSFITELERIYGITEGLLRTLVIRKDNPTVSGIKPDSDFESDSGFGSDDDSDIEYVEPKEAGEAISEPEIEEIEIEEIEEIEVVEPEIEVEAESEEESEGAEAETEPEVEETADSESE